MCAAQHFLAIVTASIEPYKKPTMPVGFLSILVNFNFYTTCYAKRTGLILMPGPIVDAITTLFR